MSDQPDEILTIDEVATYLKAGKRTVYRLASGGKIPAFKLEGHLALSPCRVEPVDRQSHWQGR